jgi:hypothetical protein
MIARLLEEIHASFMRPPVVVTGEAACLTDVIASKVEDLRLQDTTGLSSLCNVMLELMEDDTITLPSDSLSLGRSGVGAEEALVILITDLLVAAYKAKFEDPIIRAMSDRNFKRILGGSIPSRL